jgi:hypothetical protein
MEGSLEKEYIVRFLKSSFFGLISFVVTSYADYTIPYILNKRNPAIIISWLFAGNVYPVIENPDSENSLMGKALMKGYTSHYVITNKMGRAMTSKNDASIDYFDEFVCLCFIRMKDYFISCYHYL